METLLSRQLQQAYLETQLRKQNGELSSPSSSSGSQGVSNPLFQQHTSSSSSSSWDPGSEESTMSAPPMQSQDLDEGSFHDPSLQYIKKMLMDEEDLDDRKCMMGECMSYFQTMNGFYEILGSEEVPPLPRLNEPEAPWVFGQAAKEENVHVQSGNEFTDVSEPDSFSDLPVYEDSSSHSVLADEGGQSWISAQNDEKSWVSVGQNNGEASADGSVHAKQPWKFSSKEDPGISGAEDAANADREKQQWINDFFVSLNDIVPEQHAPADTSQSAEATSFVHFGHSDSSRSSNFSLQHSFDSSRMETHEQNGLFKFDSTSPSSVLGDSSSLIFSRSNTKALHTDHGNGKPSSNLGVNEANLMRSHGTKKPYSRSASDTTHTLPSSKTSRATSNGKYKRAVSEVGFTSAIDNISIKTFNSGSDGVDLDAIEEETVSFVQNKDLNAEKYGSILNDGIGAWKKGGCGKHSPASTRESGGKPTIVIVTVADLKGLLLSCAQAVASNNIRRANEILQEIRQDATPYGSGLQRLAHYFSEGLVARLSGTGERLYSVFISNSPSAAKLLKAHHHFVEVCPFFKLSHYFANRAIVKAAKGAASLHIVDFGILYGIQWPSLISALAERKGGPPVLRITGIDCPQPGTLHSERIDMTGKRLAEYAKAYGVPFEYQAMPIRWETFKPSDLNLKQDEVVIVNSMHRMHHLLDETVVASNPRQTVLCKILEINPKIFVHGIKNGNYNAPFFTSRFKETLASFSGFFDMLESVLKNDSQERMMMERELLGRTILNVIACEGPERVERPETYRQWQNRTIRAGFDPILLNQNVLKESQSILKCYDKNFTVDEDGSWMLLSWKGKVHQGLSLWKPSSH